MKNTKIVEILFGSHLYGCATPASDKDYKGIWMPTIEDVLLGRIPKQYVNSSTGDHASKNTNEDVDIEIFSLHNFIENALNGQTFAVDMLHVNKACTILTSAIWQDLVFNREKFYSKNMDSFVG